MKREEEDCATSRIKRRADMYALHPPPGTIEQAGKDRVGFESQRRDGLPTRGWVCIDQSGNYCHRNITRDVTRGEGKAERQG